METAAQLFIQTEGMSTWGWTNYKRLDGHTVQLADDFEVPPGEIWTIERVNLRGFLNLPALQSADPKFLVQIYDTQYNDTYSGPPAPGDIVFEADNQRSE